MTPKHVLVLLFPGYGHVNPTLEISRMLIALGHRVSYVLDERLAGPVAAAGARTVPYTSRRGRLAGGTGTVSGEEIAALGLTFLRESMEVILPLTLEAFEDDIPDLVLYDLESFFTARTAARRWGRPTAQLFPYIATNEHYSLNREVMAGAGESLEKSVELVADFLTGEGEGPDAVWPFLANFDERNIVLLPRELQPHGDTFDERYTFTGHSLPADRPGTGSWSRPAGDGPVALITLGTEVNDRPDFFETCGAAFADGGWHLVVTVGPGNLPAGRPVPGHVEMHEWLAFNTVLPHVSAVVCHSGMSTMLESLSFGKPLVVVTYTPEDRVNGRRVTALGLGVEVPGTEATAERLRAAVEHVVSSPDIRRRVARMRMNLLAAGGPARAARVIDDWLNEPFPTSGESMEHTVPSGAPESAGT
ncbi:macrolide family glycosyltransferase [Streptomyces sp. NPDC086080]|uniref:macrolide family glycosyltransferase n=1 Tax=Streptomyces sp. NPDC086080 TaxID=3365748 RepID=UPI0037CD2BE4